MKRYFGIAGNGHVYVEETGQERRRLNVKDELEGAFGWKWEDRVAHAILVDAMDSDAEARIYRTMFRTRPISSINLNGDWTLSADDVADRIKEMKAARKDADMQKRNPIGGIKPMAPLPGQAVWDVVHDRGTE